MFKVMHCKKLPCSPLTSELPRFFWRNAPDWSSGSAVSSIHRFTEPPNIYVDSTPLNSQDKDAVLRTRKKTDPHRSYEMPNTRSYSTDFKGPEIRTSGLFS